MTKGRTTLILLAGILVLGAFIWLQEVWRANVPSKTIRRIRLFDLNPETLVSIRFQHTNLVVECVKENGLWMTGESGKELGRADIELVYKMIAGLNSMGKGTTITMEHMEVRGLDASEYGFDQPSVEIIAVDHRGQHRWLVGRNTPFDDMVYIMEAEGEEIYTVLDMLLSIVPAEADVLRDRTLFAGDTAGVRRIEIRNSSGFIQLLKDTRSDWQIQQPVIVAADPTAVEEWLDKLYRLRIHRFEAENVSDFSPYGLQAETRQVSIGGADGTSRMLMIGDEIADRPGYFFARRADDTAVFWLKAEDIALLEVRRDDLRDARVQPLPIKDVSYVSLARGAEQLELVSDGSRRWTITKPVTWEADSRVVGQLLGMWDAAVITEFEVTNAPAVSPEWQVAFGSADLGRTNRIAILPTLGKKDGLCIMREGDPSVSRINLPQVPDSILDPLVFKDRVLWRLQKEEIQKIALEKASQPRQVVERQADGMFAPAETNGSVQVDTDALEHLMFELEAVSTPEYVAYNPRDLSIYGLMNPSIVLRMGLAGTNQLGRVLLVGQEATEGYYAMVKGYDVVFILDKPFVESISGDLVTMRGPSVPDVE